MTKAARIKRLRQDTIYESTRNYAKRILRDYFHAVQQEAIELEPDWGIMSNMQAMRSVMKSIGIKVK